MTTFTPAPGAAPLPRMVGTHAMYELRTLLRNGEQLLLTLIIPVGLLVLFSKAPLLDAETVAPGGGTKVDFLTPGILALAIMSTAFTGQAIATGFERRYGVLKRLGATPLPRSGLIAGKTLAVFAVELLQVAVLAAVALSIGWKPHGNPFSVILLILLGTAAFSSFGLLMAGTLRAEATLAGANLVYLALLALGGVMFPLSTYPESLRPLLELLPISALSSGLRDVLRDGSAFPLTELAVLACWTGAGMFLASRFFKWELSRGRA